MRLAVSKFEHFPAISQLEIFANEIGLERRTGWKYIIVEDCFSCGGPGWHWVKDFKGNVGPARCERCEAGKNLEKAPKEHKLFTQKDLGSKAEYLGPGTRGPSS